MRDPLSDAIQSLQQGMPGRARKLCKQALKQSPGHPEASYLLGIIALQGGRKTEAVKYLKKAVAGNPGQARYHIGLGSALESLGRAEAAIASYRRAVRLEPDNAEMHNSLGNTLRTHGHLEEAITEYRTALDLNPAFSEAHSNLGIALRDLEQYDEAIEHLERAIALNPGFALAHNNLALVLERLDRNEEAIRHYLTAIGLEPGNDKYHNNIAQLYLDTGRFEECLRHIREVLRLQPTSEEAIRLLATYAGHVAIEEEDEAVLAAVLDQPRRWPDDILSLVHLTLGRILDKRGEYRPAFRHFIEGNRLREKSSPFDLPGHEQYITELMHVFGKDFFRQPPEGGSDSERPVFIVGMPRSGTSLVEQILATHPQVAGAGELDDFGEFARELPTSLNTPAPYPKCMDSVDTQTLGTIAGRYLRHLDRFRTTDEQRITDKMPQNFLHLGLIATCFPKARIIHCRRNPLDTCISCFSQDFSETHAYRHNLATLGGYYRQYERLMAHWKAVLPMPILEVRYEELVSAQEETSRRMVEFLGLEWDERCLQFHTTQRKVKTASVWQVRQPIYTSSVDRWRHYEDFLGPLKEALGIRLDTT